MKIKKVYFLIFLLFLTLPWYISYAEEKYTEGNVSITFDPPTDNYIISYPNSKGEMIHVPWELPNKVVPKVKSSVTFNPESDRFIYKYSIANEKSAKQPIGSIDLLWTKKVPLIQHVDPDGWYFMKHSGPSSVWLGGSGKPVFDKYKLIYPGKSVSGFSLTSQGLPGIVSGQFVGRPIGPTQVFPDEPPQEVDTLSDKINSNPKNRYVELKTVGPVVQSDKLTNEQLLDRLVKLSQEALQLGWIDDQGIAKNSADKLNAAKEKLQAAQLETASNILHSLIHDLEGQRYEGEAKDRKPEDKDKHVSTNGFYLLKPNAEFILYKLGQSKKPDEKK